MFAFLILFQVLLTFSVLFAGFMFSMMIEFRSHKEFQNIWFAFTKTFAMTSEIQFEDLFKKSAEHNVEWSLIPRLIVIMFIILVTIILVNQIVGLSVRDVKSLEAQGKTYKLAQQVRFLLLFFMIE